MTGKIIAAATIALSLGLLVTVIFGGIAINDPLRSAQMIALVIITVIVIFGGAIIIGLKMAGWSDQTSEEDFDRLVDQSEQLARSYQTAEDNDLLDPFSDEGFRAIVSQALDDLPTSFHDALDDNLAVVIGDSGQEHGAYGLYRGGGSRRNHSANQIIIFRDTLLRDFAYDPLLLRNQITRVVRHEVAHHLGFDEPGVRSLGL